MKFSVAIACNNRNGNFTGKAFSIRFFINDIEAVWFEPKLFFWGQKFNIEYRSFVTLFGLETKETIVFDNKLFPIVNGNEHVGNICWNQYYLNVETWIDFLNTVFYNENWDYTEGLEAIVERLEKEPLDNESMTVVLMEIM